jgi:hypothetical protein
MCIGRIYVEEWRCTPIINSLSPNLPRARHSELVIQNALHKYFPLSAAQMHRPPFCK